MSGHLITKNLSKRSRLKKKKQQLCDRINQCKSLKELEGWEKTFSYHDVLKDDFDWDYDLDNYEQVDDVLKTMYYPKEVSIGKHDEEYIRLIDFYNEQGVDKVMVLHQNTAYKRIPAPIKPTKEELGLC